MRKLGVLLVAVFCVALPARASLNFYRTADGQIVVEATDCQSAQHLMDVVESLPDDPPTTPDDTDPASDTPDDPPTTPDEDPTNDDQPNPDVVKGTQQLLDALLGEDDTNPEHADHSYLSNIEVGDGLDFEDLQEALLTFVRDVNWKTGLKLTYRDLGFFRRFRMACSGVNSLTKPLRVNLESYVGSLDSAIDKASDRLTEGMIDAARGHSFDAMTKLSVVGIAYAIEKDNPFLLLLVDEETFNKLVTITPKISTLYKDMFTFFKIRAIYMPGDEFDQNTKSLIRVSQLGEGDSYDTWHTMAEFAKKMLTMQRADKLTAKDEKEIHIWRLESTMRYIKEQVRIEKRAAELALRDPQNAQLVYEVKHSPKKKPSLDEKARMLLRNSSEDEIKHLIKKYYGE